MFWMFTAQLVIDVGVPIGEEDDELEPGIDEVLDLLGHDHPADSTRPDGSKPT